MNKINFEVESAEIIEENPDSQFATAKIRAFSSGRNRHDMTCSEEVLQRTAKSIYNKPILYSIDRVLNDFYTHVDPDKSLIAGFVVPDSAEFIQLPDSRLSLNIFAKIWKRYAPKVIELFARDSSATKKISVEMELYDSEKRPDGLVEMLDFAYAGVTLLGDFITEASPGANMQMVSFSEENERYKEAVELEFGKYDDVDFTIPPKVKENAQKAFDLYKKYNVGGGSASLSNAKYLLKNEKASPERIRQMIKKLQYQKKKDIVSNEQSPSADFVNWMMYGGSEGFEWCNQVFVKLEELDNKKISYFSDNEKQNKKEKENMEDFEKIENFSIEDETHRKLGAEKFSLNSEQLHEILNNSLSDYHYGDDGRRKYWIYSFDDIYAYVRDEEVDKTYRMIYELSGNTATVFVDSKEEVIHGGFILVSEKEVMSVTDEEKQKLEEEEKAKKEKEAQMALDDEAKKKEEEAKNKEKEEFSLDPYLDVKATLAFLEKETENYEEVAAEFSKPYAEMNYGLVMGAMYAKMCKMAEKMTNMEKDAEVYMAENTELKKFKADKEQEQFNFAVDIALKDIESKTEITVEELESLREKAKEFSLETFDVWKNLARSRGLDFAAKGKQEEGVKRYGLPFPGDARKVNGSPWTR